MDFETIVKQRYSVRDFDDRIIPDKIFYKIFDLSRNAPSAKNFQPYRAYIITDYTIIDELKHTIKSITNGRNLVLITSKTTEAWVNKRRNNYSISDIDVGIFASYVVLSAWNYGIGSCFIGMFDDKDVRKIINIPDDEIPALLISMGYISNSSTPSEKYHFIRKSVSELVSYCSRRIDNE